MPNSIYGDMGLNEYFQPLDAPISRDVIKSPYDFDSETERGSINNASVLLNAIDNAKIRNSYRAYNVVVSATVGDGDTNDIQTAIDSLNDLDEGGIILIRPGTYLPEAPIILYSNITLIGVDPTNCIIDCEDMGDASGGGIQIKGTLITDDGTVSVTNGDATVTGSGSQFSTDSVAAGNFIYIKGVKYEVLSVASDTSLELTQNYDGATDSGLSYDILDSVENVTIKNLTIKDGSDASTTGPGIELQYADNCLIDNCKVFNGDSGIILNGYDCTVINTECNDNGFAGIEFGRTVSCFLKDNICSNNTSSGIYIFSALSENHGVIDNCIANSNGSYGFRFFVSKHIICRGCIAVGNNTHGIFLEGATFNTITGCLARANGTDGIHVTNRVAVDSEFNTILACDASENGDDGIELTSGANYNNASYCMVQNNTGTALVNSGTGNVTAGNI